MDANQRATIRKCRVRLVKDLMIDDMFDYIETCEVFTPVMLEYIKAKESRPEKVRVFLDYLQRRGPDAFDKFLDCLRQSGHTHLNSYVVQEYMNQCGMGISRLNIQSPGDGQSVQASSSRPINMYISQETQGPASQEVRAGQQEVRAGQHGVRAGQQEVRAGLQEVSGPEELRLSTEENFTTGRTEPADEDMDTDVSNEVHRQTMNLPYNEEDSQRGPPTRLPSVDPATISINQGYTGNLQEEYRMESDPRGLLVIINNKTFAGGLSNRDGTDVDCQMLKHLFMSLGFGVDVKNDLTALEIKVNLTILSRLEQLRTVDSLTVAILTHGSEEILYGVDGQYIHVNDAFKPFNAVNCPALHHKPKFFIINACRGDNETQGIQASGSYESSVVVQDVELVPDTEPIPSQSVENAERIHNMQDFLLAYSTIPGHVSWRHMNEGSWFIQGLVRVFSEHARTKDVISMLVKVNREVAQSVSYEGVQIPAPQIMLTKTWYLNPLIRNPVTGMTL